MAGAVEITLQDLDDRFTARMVRSVFCDNGSNTPSASRLGEALSAGRREADAYLMVAWTPEQIETLIVEDSTIRAAVLDLVMAEGMAGRGEWDSEGGPRDRLEKRASSRLKLLANAEKRSRAEDVAGINPHTTSVKVRTRTNPQTFVFAPSRAKPTRGGF